VPEIRNSGRQRSVLVPSVLHVIVPNKTAPCFPVLRPIPNSLVAGATINVNVFAPAFAGLFLGLSAAPDLGIRIMRLYHPFDNDESFRPKPGMSLLFLPMPMTFVSGHFA
jgi:hypothetical protein